MTDTTKREGLSRRTIAKGMAWSAPVIVAGAPAALAAVTPDCLDVTMGEGSCRYTAGTKDYYLKLCFTNNCDREKKIQVTSVTNGSGFHFSPDPAAGAVLTLSPGETECLPVAVYGNNGSNAAWVFVSYSVWNGTSWVMQPNPLQTKAPTTDCP